MKESENSIRISKETKQSLLTVLLFCIVLQVNEIFTGRTVKAPALNLFFRDDPIATAKENDELVEQWRKHLESDLDVKCCRTPHFAKHSDE